SIPPPSPAAPADRGQNAWESGGSGGDGGWARRIRQLTPKIDSPIPTIPRTIQPVQSRLCVPPVWTLIVGVVVLAGSMVGNVCSVVLVVDEELVVVVDRD